MRNPGLVIVLVVLALVPIAVWGYTAYGTLLSHQMAEQGARKAGQAAAILLMILAALTPAFVGGILMIVGAALSGRKPLGARVAATLGLALIILTVAVFIAYEGAIAGYELIAAATAYALLHAAVMVWVWRGRRQSAV